MKKVSIKFVKYRRFLYPPKYKRPAQLPTTCIIKNYCQGTPFCAVS